MKITVLIKTQSIQVFYLIIYFYLSKENLKNKKYNYNYEKIKKKIAKIKNEEQNEWIYSLKDIISKTDDSIIELITKLENCDNLSLKFFIHSHKTLISKMIISLILIIILRFIFKIFHSKVYIILK